MNKYNNSKIYKIISKNTNMIYIGSTIQKYISSIKAAHSCNYNKWKSEKGKYCSSFDIFKFGDVSIHLLESYKCADKDTLRAREQYWIIKYNNIIVNTTTLYLTEWEKKEKNRIKSKKHRISNPQYYIKYRNNHKDHKKEQNELYKTRNPYYFPNYYKNNKKHMNRKYTCVCGSTIYVVHKLRHERTIKHKKYITNKTLDILINAPDDKLDSYIDALIPYF